MGTSPELRASILATSRSTQQTSLPKSAKTVPVTSPTYPVPITQISMFHSCTIGACARLHVSIFGRRNSKNHLVRWEVVEKKRGAKWDWAGLFFVLMLIKLTHLTLTNTGQIRPSV